MSGLDIPKEEKSREGGMKRRDFLKTGFLGFAGIVWGKGTNKPHQKDLKNNTTKQEKLKFKFDIKSKIEQKPFQSLAVKNFFGAWMEVQDEKIRPLIVSRKNWERLSKDGLSLWFQEENKQCLFIPDDLHLWEVIPFLEVLDKLAYKSRHPEKLGKKPREILKLGKVFKNAGIYINKRLDSISEGRSIAEDLAKEFYRYGQSIIYGEKFKRGLGWSRLIRENISQKETEEVDRFLAGEKLYGTRLKKSKDTLGRIPKKKKYQGNLEKVRQDTLCQFFRISQRAFEGRYENYKDKKPNSILKGFNEQGEPIYEDLKPWESKTLVGDNFIKKVEGRIIEGIEALKRELLVNASFRIGIENTAHNLGFDKLLDHFKILKEKKDNGHLNKFEKREFKEMGAFIDIFKHWQIEGCKTLYNGLKVPKLKLELNTLRESGNLKMAGNKEMQIFNKIQAAITSYIYGRQYNNPSEILSSQIMNCVGASIAGHLLSEVGIDYGVTSLPKHCVLMMVTSTGEPWWADMINPSGNKMITDDMIVGQKPDGSTLKASDLVRFIRNPQSQKITFEIASKYKKMFKWIKDNEKLNIILYPKEIGQRIQLLNNFALILSEKDFAKEAKEALNLISPRNPNTFYENLGWFFAKIGDQEKKVVENTLLAIKNNPSRAHPYYILGHTFSKMGERKKAIEIYEEFIKLADEKEYGLYISVAKYAIKRLERELITKL